MNYTTPLVNLDRIKAGDTITCLCNSQDTMRQNKRELHKLLAEHGITIRFEADDVRSVRSNLVTPRGEVLAVGVLRTQGWSCTARVVGVRQQYSGTIPKYLGAALCLVRCAPITTAPSYLRPPYNEDEWTMTNDELRSLLARLEG